MTNEILGAYKSVTVKHARLADVHRQMENIHCWPDGEQVVLLVGPTGVGKSRLLSRLHTDCAHYYAEAMEQDAGFVPSILMKLPSPTPRISGRSEFDWKDAFNRLLESGDEVLIRRKTIPRINIELDGEVITNISRLVASEQRRAIENFVKYRRVRQAIFDEAGHIFSAGTSSNYHLHFELLKSMAIAFQRPLILSGSYNLLKVLELNGQLTRRIEVIHFLRYTLDDFGSAENPKPYGCSFSDAVFTLLERMPIPKEDGLIDGLEFFLMKSLGCIGLLKEWFERALKYALQAAAPVLTRKVLEQTALPNKSLIRILGEIKLGESMLEDVSDQILAQELGLEATPTLNLKKQSPPLTEASEIIKKPAANKKRPGTRNPGRDPVGGYENAA